jgi:hypothetical protein
LAQFVSRMIRRRAGQIAVVLAMAAGAAGCLEPGVATSSKGQADLNSPVAKEILAASKHPGRYPRFADIPKTPTDVRPAAAWKSAVVDLEARRTTLNVQAAALPPPLADTEAFAAKTRAQTPATSEAPPADARQQSEAYAKALRERATPPPPPN